MNKTRIEWCDTTLNPVVGCTHGCEYCYARKINNRFYSDNDFLKPKYYPERLRQIEKAKNKLIFLNSMSDVMDWNDEWLIDVFEACNRNKANHYVLLTKRYEDFIRRLDKLLVNHQSLNKEILILGGTVTKQEELITKKLYDLLNLEPIHEHIDLQGIMASWVIIGAETGKRKEKIIPKKEWILEMVAILKSDAVMVAGSNKEMPIFMKDSLIELVGEENMLREYPSWIARSGAPAAKGGVDYKRKVA